MGAPLHPYATAAYARTLRHVGEPVHVPEWGTWLIAREIERGLRDVMGPYPLTCLADDADVARGLARLREQGFVSLAIVVDDLRRPVASLAPAFDFCRAFKTHYVVDQVGAEYRPSKHHQFKVRRAGRHGVETRIVRLGDILDAWVDLYGELVARHRPSSLHRFPRDSFEALLDCDGLTAVAAFVGRDLVSCHLWIEHEGLTWSHLGASSALGYASSAAYAVHDHSILHFAGRKVDLGGAAGITARSDDGLARFKAGFANATAQSYVLGGVLDPVAYARLSARNADAGAGTYFPAYRTPAPAAAPAPEPHAAR